MDKVFSALGDKSRRYLLDILYRNNGLTLSQLTESLEMSRQAVTKHLKILEEADLVVPVWQGREKHHYLNPVPLHEIHTRWMNKFEKPRLDGLYQMKDDLEDHQQEENMSGFMYQIVVSASVERVWESLTQAAFTKKFWFGRSVNSDWQISSPVNIVDPEGKVEASGKVVTFDLNKRLSYTWVSSMDPTHSMTTVVFELQEMGPLTKLTILQDIDAESAMFQQAASGWTFILCGLKTYLETGEAMPAIPWSK